MKTSRLLIALLVLSFAWLPFTVADESRPVEVKPAEKKAETAEHECYYYVFLQGSRVGWGKATLGKANIDGKELIVEGMHVYMKIKRLHDGAEFENTVETRDYSTPEGRPVRSWQTGKEGDQSSKKEIEYGEKEFTVTLTVNGKSKVTKIAREHDDHYSGMYVYEQLKKAGFKPGTVFKYHGINPDAGKVHLSTVTVVGKTEFKTAEGITYSGVQVSSVTGEETTTMIFDEAGMPLRLELANGYVRADRTPKMPEDFKPDVFEGMANIMHSDVAVPAAEQHSLKAMEIHFKYKHDDAAGVPLLFDTSAYHDVVKYDRDGETGYALRLKSQKLPDDFAAPALPMADVPADIKRFLDPSPHCASDDAELMAAAAKETKGAKDTLDATRRLSKFVSGYLADESGTTGSATASEAFKEKKGDCTEHSALFVALARATGLPARCCSGIVYLTFSTGKGIFGYHAWSEVWLGRWVPVDATVDEVGTSPRYLLMSYSAPVEDYGASRNVRMMQQEGHPAIDFYETGDGKSWTRKDFKRFDFSKPLQPK